MVMCADCSGCGAVLMMIVIESRRIHWLRRSCGVRLLPHVRLSLLAALLPPSRLLVAILAKETTFFEIAIMSDHVRKHINFRIGGYGIETHQNR